jgi:hypothetical protein
LSSGSDDCRFQLMIASGNLDMQAAIAFDSRQPQSALRHLDRRSALAKSAVGNRHPPIDTPDPLPTGDRRLPIA